MPGLDRVLLIGQRDAALAARDELESEKRKVPPIHDKIRRTPLAAAAHEAERARITLTFLPLRQKKASGAHDLRRKVVGLVGGGHGLEHVRAIKNRQAAAKDGQNTRFALLAR